MGYKVNHKRMNPKRPNEDVAKREWCKGQLCYLSHRGGCYGDISGCHTPDPATKGTGMKSSDRYMIPMCYFHHSVEQHNIGWTAFCRKHDFDHRDAANVIHARYEGAA